MSNTSVDAGKGRQVPTPRKGRAIILRQLRSRYPRAVWKTIGRGSWHVYMQHVRMITDTTFSVQTECPVLHADGSVTEPPRRRGHPGRYLHLRGRRPVRSPVRRRHVGADGCAGPCIPGGTRERVPEALVRRPAESVGSALRVPQQGAPAVLGVGGAAGTTEAPGQSPDRRRVGPTALMGSGSANPGVR
jgi:hypothetical protein